MGSGKWRSRDRLRSAVQVALRGLGPRHRRATVRGVSDAAYNLRETLPETVKVKQLNPDTTALEHRATEEDRRVATRGGRRETDPKPTCPSCGLPVKRPHGSDSDCIAMLKEEIAKCRGSGLSAGQPHRVEGTRPRRSGRSRRCLPSARPGGRCPDPERGPPHRSPAHSDHP